MKNQIGWWWLAYVFGGFLIVSLFGWYTRFQWQAAAVIMYVAMGCSAYPTSTYVSFKVIRRLITVEV